MIKIASLTGFFIQVFMKPGKPITFAEVLPGSTENIAGNKILAFGLPGNPVSCLVCYHLFVVPTIRHLSGWTQPHLPRFLRIVDLSLSIFLFCIDSSFLLIYKSFT